jgi:hypothetical protein
MIRAVDAGLPGQHIILNLVIFHSRIKWHTGKPGSPRQIGLEAGELRTNGRQKLTD